MQASWRRTLEAPTMTQKAMIIRTADTEEGGTIMLAMNQAQMNLLDVPIGIPPWLTETLSSGVAEMEGQTTHLVIVRTAMRDGAITPESTGTGLNARMSLTQQRILLTETLVNHATKGTGTLNLASHPDNGESGLLPVTMNETYLLHQSSA